jgi:two-component system, OmpR family, phosphate regulon sensor histidine kinase PhoR
MESRYFVFIDSMKKSKNSLTIILMSSSIVLMLVLEIFWLQGAFRDEFAQLRRETNFIFRTTVFAMHDSLIQKSIKPSNVDGTDSIPTRLLKGARYFIDTKMKHGEFDKTYDNVQIYINAPDSDGLTDTFHRPVIRTMRKGGAQRSFTFKLGNDSLSKADVERNYKKALGEARLSLNFKIKAGKPGPAEIQSTITNFETDWMPIPSFHYVASFGDVHFTILKKITPQILFSVFLSSLTIISFIFMYRSIRSQQRLMELKNDFISNITHELKTPIATVSVALEALKNFNGIENPVRTREYLDIAQDELSRLSILTDKVLNTSFFDSKGVAIETEKIDLEKTVDSILNSMKLLIEKEKAKVLFEKTGSDFLIEGSSVHLTNVIYNLLDNALKYSPSHPDICIVLNDLGETVSFSVSDKGLGIPEEFQKKIFEKFFRMPTGDVHTTKGYGLGLSYVEGVVKAHSGKIEVKSELGNGSTFTITLPKKFNPHK